MHFAQPLRQYFYFYKWKKPTAKPHVHVGDREIEKTLYRHAKFVESIVFLPKVNLLFTNSTYTIRLHILNDSSTSIGNITHTRITQI